MSEFYFSVNLDNDRTLCIAPLTDRKIAMSGQDIPDPSGYFLYERRNSDQFAGVQIIAQVLSEDAVLKLCQLFNMR